MYRRDIQNNLIFRNKIIFSLFQSNATAAKVCIKKNSQSPPAKQKPTTMSDNFNKYRNGSEWIVFHDVIK